MIVGVPKEIKANENRVALVPAGAETLSSHGHTVIVESGAGDGSGFSDGAYERVGARVVDAAAPVWSEAEMILKVKEPVAEERERIHEDQVVFTYFHFAADEGLTRSLMESGGVAIAYETVQLPDGELPLLTPMSEVAGRMAVQEGAKYLEKSSGGSGILLGGVPGVLPAKVVILGGGVVGSNAARIAAGFGAHVTILDVNLGRLRYLADVMPANVDTLFSNRHTILEQLEGTDLLVGAVLVPGAKAPSLVRREDLKRMKDGSVIVDVAVDQGGCVETTRMTTHSDPVYTVDGVLHYCVGNMPGAVARTATLGLTNATLPWILKLAEHGPDRLAQIDPTFATAVNMTRGILTNQPVADAHSLEFEPLAV